MQILLTIDTKFFFYILIKLWDYNSFDNKLNINFNILYLQIIYYLNLYKNNEYTIFQLEFLVHLLPLL